MGGVAGRQSKIWRAVQQDGWGHGRPCFWTRSQRYLPQDRAALCHTRAYLVSKDGNSVIKTCTGDYVCETVKDLISFFFFSHIFCSPMTKKSLVESSWRICVWHEAVKSQVRVILFKQKHLQCVLTSDQGRITSWIFLLTRLTSLCRFVIALCFRNHRHDDRSGYRK